MGFIKHRDERQLAVWQRIQANVCQAVYVAGSRRVETHSMMSASVLKDRGRGGTDGGGTHLKDGEVKVRLKHSGFFYPDLNVLCSLASLTFLSLLASPECCLVCFRFGLGSFLLPGRLFPLDVHRPTPCTALYKYYLSGDL